MTSVLVFHGHNFPERFPMLFLIQKQNQDLIFTLLFFIYFWHKIFSWNTVIFQVLREHSFLLFFYFSNFTSTWHWYVSRISNYWLKIIVAQTELIILMLSLTALYSFFSICLWIIPSSSSQPKPKTYLKW